MQMFSQKKCPEEHFFYYIALLGRLVLSYSCVLLDRLGLDGGHRVAGPVRGG